MTLTPILDVEIPRGRKLPDEGWGAIPEVIKFDSTMPDTIIQSWCRVIVKRNGWDVIRAHMGLRKRQTIEYVAIYEDVGSDDIEPWERRIIIRCLRHVQLIIARLEAE